MYFEDVREWQGTAEAVTKELKRQIEQLGLSVEAPAVRTVRLWRSKQLLSQPKGQEFRFRQILEGLAVALLLKRGWTLAAIAQILPSFPDITLEQQIIAEANGADPTWLPQMPTTSLPLPVGHASASDLAEDAAVLLAQGILRQYTRVLNREIVRQDDSMPSELYRAMCKLGRLYIEAGLSDRADRSRIKRSGGLRACCSRTCEISPRSVGVKHFSSNRLPLWSSNSHRSRLASADLRLCGNCQLHRQFWRR